MEKCSFLLEIRVESYRNEVYSVQVEKEREEQKEVAEQIFVLNSRIHHENSYFVGDHKDCRIIIRTPNRDDFER